MLDMSHMWQTEWDPWPLDWCLHPRQRTTGNQSWHWISHFLLWLMVMWVQLMPVLPNLYLGFFWQESRSRNSCRYRWPLLSDDDWRLFGCFRLFCRSRRRRFLGREQDKEMRHKKYPSLAVSMDHSYLYPPLFYLLHYIISLLKLCCENSSIVTNLVHHRAFCNARLAICMYSLYLAPPFSADRNRYSTSEFIGPFKYLNWSPSSAFMACVKSNWLRRIQ